MVIVRTVPWELTEPRDFIWHAKDVPMGSLLTGQLQRRQIIKGRQA